MLPAVPINKAFNNHPLDVIELQASMCHAVQPGTPRPIARWILEEGQLLGVLVASFPSPLFQSMSTCN